MATSFINKDGMPTKDPYKALGVASTATDTEIKKAYRQMALKLHPDKQSGTLTDAEREDLDRQFHIVKEARSFLLDSDHAQARQKYKKNLASERVRLAEEERRDRTMSSRRKRMREELNMRERMAKSAASSTVSSDEKDKFDVDRLRREGEKLREEYSKREAAVELARKQRMAVERAAKKLDKDDRQVRLKWSRRKVSGGVHTRHSLTELMREFGSVDSVELLGSKGNSALVTFADASSCKSCVDAYKMSDAMRASFVGRRKVDDNVHIDQSDTEHTRKRAAETTIERTMRQAAEREKLMRQMEMEEAGEDMTKDDDSKPSAFPPVFPLISENEGLTPFAILERYESSVMDRIT
ncbi:hypothetical protein THAOC_34922 [Thalassiosira oceanica]|uniref:J domain-containing protein n=1 Tax=Thalassiosira oceanica TaxID=159749 RepID=K0RID6_THAOC|nr:hypothetical protein THAOC_34922 [Thalassiosira oceanica]|mmetsp:Transcript_20844/g.48957  ORF Transcript_20844/g.48957 Transcript_20844/m.48957 type:complete len:354 (-) Transcript_20844:1236-2297(-)|eukprot:EJK46407.1 hypothetical protein THAOC_34922 [Thalassiosira oceanica]